ncbi:AAA family ATPase, partial [Kitasatospora cineracea]
LILERVLDDGRLTDAQGRTVDFRNTVVIMTSNIGSQLILSHKGETEEIRDRLMEELRGRFLPEFLNRIDDIIVFDALDADDLLRIVDLMLANSERRVRAQGMELEVTAAAKDWLVGKGHQPEFGARPLRRTIQTQLDNRLATMLLGGDLRPGDTIVADAEDGELICSIGRPEAS